MNKSINEVVNIAGEYLKQRKEVTMAFLFGSYASGNICSESDVDIALFMKNENNDAEVDIQNNIERLLGKEVDLVILSRATPVLAWNILRKGVRLVIKDRKAYLDFLLDVSGEAQDFLEFNFDAWRRKYGIRTS